MFFQQVIVFSEPIEHGHQTVLGDEPFDHILAEGGHGGAADNRQRAYKLALEYAFLQHTLVDK